MATTWLTVGWSMRETLHASIALEALEMAIKRQRPAPALIQHSDRGIQYAADEYRQALAAAKITPSISRKGNCLEFKPVRASGSDGPGDRSKAQNAPMEVRPLSRTDRVRGLTYHTLKVERVHHRVYATRAKRAGIYSPTSMDSTIHAACIPR